MDEFQAFLIVVGVLTGAAGGSVVGIANDAAARRPPRPLPQWVGPALAATVGLGGLAAAVGLYGLLAGRGIGLPLGVLAIGALVVMAALHVRRRLRVQPPEPPAISKPT